MYNKDTTVSQDYTLISKLDKVVFSHYLRWLYISRYYIFATDETRALYIFSFFGQNYLSVIPLSIDNPEILVDSRVTDT